MPDDTTLKATLADLQSQLKAAGDDPERLADALADGVRRTSFTDAQRRRIADAATGNNETAPVALEPLAPFATEPEPPAVLWRDPEPDEPEHYADAVLSAGEVAILASPGGMGKSTVTLDLARAAVSASGPDNFGTACGLRVRAGPVAILNYEDSPVRMANRLDRMSGAAGIPDTIRLWRDPAPLFVADHGEARPCPQWPALWKAVRDLDPSLVIVDPASAAMAGVSVSEGGPVRAFMRALTGEAERGGFGVLIVAHDTKAARNEAKAGGDPGAGAVAGSATWFDAARGVLYMRRDPDSDGGRKVECIKANYGRTGWTVHLRERLDNCGRFTGFEAVPAASDGGGAGKVPSV